MQNNLPNGWGGNSGPNPWGNKPSTGGSPWDKAKKEPFAETPKSAPFSDAPKQETPLKDVPVQEAPVKEAPAPEAPIQEEPTQEAPAKEAPKQEEIGTVAVPSAEVTNSKVEEAPAQEEPRVVAPPIVADTEQKPISTAEQPAKTKKTPKKATPVAVPTTKPSKGKSDDGNPKKKGNSTVALLTVLLVIVLAALIAVYSVAFSLYREVNSYKSISESTSDTSSGQASSDSADFTSSEHQHSSEPSDVSDDESSNAVITPTEIDARCFKCGFSYRVSSEYAWVACYPCEWFFPSDLNAKYSCARCGKTDLSCFFISQFSNNCFECENGESLFDHCQFCNLSGEHAYIYSDGACSICRFTGFSYCEICGSSITADEHQQANGRRCGSCMLCYVCSAPLTSNELFGNGRICYNCKKCSVCNTFLNSSELESFDGKHCFDCARCEFCYDYIDQIEYIYNGGFYCNDCYNGGYDEQPNVCCPSCGTWHFSELEETEPHTCPSCGYSW